MEIKYQFYPTLIDSFRYWKDHEEDEGAFNDLIDKLNDVKVEQTEENLKGIEFEQVINDLIDGKMVRHDFDMSLVDKVYSKLSRCIGKQVKIEGVISTKHGNVKLYGYFDYEFPEMMADLKTTSSYSLKTEGSEKVKKYKNNFQHKFISLLTPKKEFNYVITDFKYFYIENFKLGKSLNEATILEIEEFIDFINVFKYKIKDSKVFANGNLG